MVETPYSNTIRSVRSALTETFDEVDTWFDKSAEVRSYKPQDGGWSIDEVLEHITLTNYYLSLIIRKGCEKSLKRAETQGPVVSGESDLDLLAPISQPDSFIWIRPEHMEPTGTPSPEEVRALMRQQGEECLEILGRLGKGEGSLYQVRMSVNNSGKLDMYQWLFFLAQHAKRHLAQMEDCEAEWQRMQSQP
jgi:hypothetical protein